MDTEKIKRELEELVTSDDFIRHAETLTEHLFHSPDSFDAVEIILRFMESHPGIDYGMPGPFVHFLERFYGKGYEGQLLNSLKRKPTPHTVWMFNRILNGTKSTNLREEYVELLTDIVHRSQNNDPDTHRLASRFLERFTE